MPKKKIFWKILPPSPGIAYITVFAETADSKKKVAERARREMTMDNNMKELNMTEMNLEEMTEVAGGASRSSRNHRRKGKKPSAFRTGAGSRA